MTVSRYERQYVEAIVLELEKLQRDLLDAMPRLCPMLGSRSPEDWSTVNLYANIAEHSTIHERRTPTPEAGRHDGERLDMVSGKMVSDLSGSIETDGLGF